MRTDFDVIRYNVSFRYALKEWKEAFFGWNLKDAYMAGKEEIASCKNAKEYQKVVKNFFNKLKDYHAKCSFCSTEMSYFPLRVTSAENRYFITPFFDIPPGTTQEELPFLMSSIAANPLVVQAISLFEEGDELLEINDRDVAAVIEELIEEELGSDKSATGLAIAERMLFLRRGKYAQKCPQGVLKLKVKKKDGSVTTYTVPWLYIKESVTCRFLKSDPLQDNFLLKDYSSPFARDFTVPYVTAEDLRKKSFLPPLGEIIFETNKSDPEGIYAYFYQHPTAKKKIGYIVIPTFTYLDEAFVKAWMDRYLNLIQFFQEEADALVIDITNNPGGNGMFCYATLSALSGTPLKPLVQQEAINQQEVYKAALKLKVNELFPMGDATLEYFGFPITAKTRESISDYSKSVIDTWKRGEMLTDPLYLMGINEIPPHPRGHFTKPLLVLTNELCFSCADLFPAILQDNNRAKIFGKRTAGAGGYVRVFEHTSLFGVDKYSLTGSVIYRDTGEVLENGGVLPDIPYEITVKDLKSGYEGYIKAVNDALLD